MALGINPHHYCSLAGNTTDSIDFKSLDWENRKIIEIDIGTVLHHGNRAGTEGGAGQTGREGEPIWLTSANDTNAAHGYSGGHFLLKYVVQEKLRLAVLNSDGNQVFPDEIDDWQTAKNAFRLDGVLTDYGVSLEVCLFDRSKIRLSERIAF